MKWIGQHIWDFISRFRSDVYLEDLTESTQDHVVGVDADGKLYKQDVSVGDITGVTAGDALTGGGSSGALTINHEDTSSQASVNNSGSTYVQDVTLDTYGHVTGLTSAAIPTLNQDTSGTAAGLSSTLAVGSGGTGLTTVATNNILTGNGTGALTAESNLQFDATNGVLSAGVPNAKVEIGRVRAAANSPSLIQTSSGSSIEIDTYHLFGTTVPTVVKFMPSGQGSQAQVVIEGPEADGTDRTGSDIYFVPGAGTGSGTSGGFSFYGHAGGGASDADVNVPTVMTSISPGGNINTLGNVTLTGGGSGVIFEGTTPDAHETTLVAGEPTADRTVTLPNATGTVALTSQLDHDALTNFVANEHIDWTGASAGTIHATNYSNDNDDVSIANLKTRLAGGFASNAVSIGDADDTVTIPGNLTVSGTTTTINTTDLNVEDKNITLNYHATNDTSASADGAGITVQDAVNATTDATINWNATDDTWDFSHKTVMPDLSRVDGRLFLGSASLSTAFRPNTSGSSKTIDLPNLTGTASILDPFSSSYTIGTSSLSAGVYTAITNLSMGDVYNLNSTAVAITPTPHGSLTIMLTDCWVYVVTPNYPASGVANTSNWAFQIGKTTGAGTYNKGKGFEGLINRLAYNQAPNRLNVHRVTHFPNASSNYGNPEPGLPLLVWTSSDPTGSASTGSESIMSIRLVTQYTVIPS